MRLHFMLKILLKLTKNNPNSLKSIDGIIPAKKITIAWNA